MSRLLLVTLFTISLAAASAQTKYAVILSSIPNGEFDTVPVARRNYSREPLKIARNNFRLIKEGLLSQGFKEENIFFDTVTLSNKTILNLIDKVAERVTAKDFVILYSDLPMVTKSYEDKTKAHGLRLSDKEFISSNDLFTAWQSVLDNAQNPEISAIFLEGHNLMGYIAENEKRKESFKILPVMFFATSPGSIAEVHENEGLFTRALARIFKESSSHLDSYKTLFYAIRIEMQAVYPSVSPGAQSGENVKFFNGLFKSFLPHQVVLENISDSEVRITGGQSQFYATGDKVKIYMANSDTSRTTFLASGVVVKADRFQSLVKLNKPSQNGLTNMWAYISPDLTKPREITRLRFNTTYLGENKTDFNNLLNNLKRSDKLKNYVEFVTSQGDIQLSNIIKEEGKWRISFSHPVTGNVFQESLSDAEKSTSATESILINHIKFLSLEKLFNHIPELSVKVEMIPVKSRSYENGHQILYGADELSIKLTNLGPKNIYFSIMDLMPDRTAHMLVPSEQETPYDFQIPPFGTYTLEQVIIEPPYGIEKFKIFTSTTPLKYDLLLSGYFTRGNTDGRLEGMPSGNNVVGALQHGTTPMLLDINIQEVAFEIRNPAFSLEEGRSELSATRSVNQKQQTEIRLAKISRDRYYYNIIKRSPDGKFQILLPNKNTLKHSLYIGEKENIQVLPGDLKNDEISVIVSDRPFDLNELTAERSINQIVADIYLSNKVPGTALNKVTIVHPRSNDATTIRNRNNEINIQFLTPQVSADRSSRNPTKEKAIDIVGLAFVDQEHSVDSLRINGESIFYDPRRQVFKQTVHLVPGRNKIVIDAWYKNTPATRVLEFELEGMAQGGSITKGKNYFLGIGIDNYNSWPKLSNAKNDVINLSRLLQSDYGFDSSNMKLILDSSATRSRIIKELREFLRKTSPNDNVIIYLAGHGNEDQLADGDYYFIAQESDVDDVSTAVKSTDIVDPFRKINAKHCVLIIDACYAGLITNSVSNQTKMKNNEDDPDALPSKWIITSGRATKVSDGEAGKNSPFAHALINYLNSGNNDQKLKITKLIEYLKEAVPKVSNQTPFGVQIEGKGEMIFSKN